MRDLSEGKAIEFETVLLDERFENFIYPKEGQNQFWLSKRTDRRGRPLI
jgi:hypothetical protein